MRIFPITISDTALIVKWRNNDSVRQNFIFQEPFTCEMHEAWMKNRVQTGEVVQYIIEDKITNEAVGSVYLRDTNAKNKSAEYGIFIGEDDAIGKGITKTLGVERVSKDGFYIAIFDGSRITEPDMDAEKEDLLKTVYLKEVVEDYQASVKMGDKEMKHRYACSGIDGLALAPSMGNPNEGKKYLYVAYGVYGDTTSAGR